MARAFAMTGKQFAQHLTRLMWGLDRLSIRLPDLIDRAKAQDCSYYTALPSIPERLLEANCIRERDNRVASLTSTLAVVNDAIAATERVVGEDWYEVAVLHKNWKAVAWRLKQRDLEVVTAWYGFVASAVDLGHFVINAELDYLYTIGMGEVEFWSNVDYLRQLPGAAFNNLLGAAADAAGAAANAAGHFARELTGGFVAGAGFVGVLATLAVGYAVLK